MQTRTVKRVEHYDPDPDNQAYLIYMLAMGAMDASLPMQYVIVVLSLVSMYRAHADRRRFVAEKALDWIQCPLCDFVCRTTAEVQDHLWAGDGDHAALAVHEY